MANKIIYNDWQITENHIYNKEVIKCNVYAKTFGRGTVYIIDGDNLTYTCSFGKNSDYSFTGSFYGLPISDIKECFKALDKFVPLWLADKTSASIENFI